MARKRHTDEDILRILREIEMNLASGSDGCDPVPDCLSNELGAVIWPDVGRDTPQDKQVGQRVYAFCRVLLPVHPDREAFAAMFVQNVQGPLTSFPMPTC